MIYHGSCISGLHTIKANSKSHSTGRLVAYFSEDRCYALVCCRIKAENFVTMGVGADGRQHYFERFPNQLESLYKGRQGYIYLLDSMDGLTHGKGHSWESEHDVPVSQCERIADVYSEILREESLGNIVIHRYAEIDPAEQKEHANYIRDHLTDEGDEMAKFYRTHFLPCGIDSFHHKTHAGLIYVHIIFRYPTSLFL